MNFLIDAQLPRRLARWLSDQGHDALHTLDPPAGNRTQDAEIIALVAQDDRIVVTKDDDFVQSFWVHDQPQRLLLISTGNIANADLERLIADNLSAIVYALGANRFVELTRTTLVIHD
jgi:predicted nuclease of predicted toxin-antitoxin system